jgi:hypothetical protein
VGVAAENSETQVRDADAFGYLHLFARERTESGLWRGFLKFFRQMGKFFCARMRFSL